MESHKWLSIFALPFPRLVFRVSVVRNLLNVPGICRRQLPSTFRIRVSKSVQFFRVVGIVKLAEKFSFYSRAASSGDAGYKLKLVGLCRPTGLESYFQGNHDKSVVGSGKLAAPKSL